MRKEMLKPVSKIFALCIALSMFVGNGAIALAACPNDEKGEHHFSKHRWTGEGYSEYGTHAHYLGRDEYNEEVYETCTWITYYKYCVNACRDCGAVQPGSRHVEFDYTDHSVTLR